ncbi:MAG TPA: ROK family protein [Verrucomicrobiae bacterium]|nr:ROK family protein [Verrucomicrobiae bacterium]
MTDLANHGIGIDVGGTKIAGGLVDLSRGAIRSRRHQPTLPQRGGDAVLADVMAQASDLAAEARALGIAVAGIGVGLPQLVSPDGQVRSAHLFDWRDLPAIEKLSGIAPARLDSDVRAAARAEARFGAGRSHRIFCYVTIGTGMSYCLVEDGKPFEGARGYAIHFATMPQWTRCGACGEVHAPVLEEIAAGPGIAGAYAKRSGRAVADGESVLAAAAGGDVEATAVICDAATATGALIGQMINMLDPEAVVIGGGLGLAGGLYGDRLVGSIRRHVFAEDARRLPVLPAALGSDAGIIGAALAGVKAT